MRVLFLFLAVSLLAGDPSAPKRVFVDEFEGGPAGRVMRELLVAALHGTGKFAVTENQERADFYLRGVADDAQYFEQFSTHEGGGGRTAASGTRREGTTLGRIFAAGQVNDSESLSVRERKREAVAAVRLVTREGDVVWSAMQESSGNKYRSAAAEVASRIARKLAEEWNARSGEKTERLAGGGGAAQ